ncbi:hypothetical protein CCY99_02475 [Helicobacter sp. 16-1353]|uniref:hypothetical protein n=1 Tax=Helicobacter sp. 16-1353 TaxID=2004996 RepID=UPI000DCF5F1C|nr:hypothetical protein [Helicobacter sp. 16-1353]RAX54648.1 hypothetical protein CCY99_02475 [Helicobacter sp. 16-1353]
MFKKLTTMLLAFGLLIQQGFAEDAESLISKLSLDGMAFIRYVTDSGQNAGGQSWIFRIAPGLTLHDINGFSFNAGILYHYSAVPVQGFTTDGAVGGSRATRDLFITGGNAFSINTLWGKYQFSKTSITLGVNRLISPFTDPGNDRAVGGTLISNDISNIMLFAGYYDSVALENALYNYSLSWGNNLGILGVNGNYDLFGFKLWYFNFDKITNGVFGEFKVGKEYAFTAQVAYNDMFKSPTYKGVSVNGVKYPHSQPFGYFINDGSGRFVGINGNRKISDNVAKSRGIYAFRISAKPLDSLNLRVGYTGSFGAGYGVGLEPNAIMTGGRWWNFNSGLGGNGLGLFGAGANENSHINHWYFAIDYKIIQDLMVNLDISGISGKNDFVTFARMQNGTKVGGIQDYRMGNATLTEFSPSISYNLTKSTKLWAYYALTIGQVQANRIWLEMIYRF